jgi:hypothetical protein
MAPSPDFVPSSEQSSRSLDVPLSILLIPAIYLAYTILSAIYLAYLHPLSHVPGPKAWAAFPVIPRILCLFGVLDRTILRYHAKHGPAMRISDKEVSFTTSEAWQQIYGFKVHPQLPKAQRRLPGEEINIVNANDADHSRFRKAIAHGFSERALRDQEEILVSYIDILVDKLKGCARGNSPTDMVRWYNYTTFDIIGDCKSSEHVCREFSC